MERFFQAINCGVEEWDSNGRYFDIALEIYDSCTPQERDDLKAAAFKQYGEDNSLPILRLYEIICQCAAYEDIEYLSRRIQIAPIEQVLLLAEIIVKSPIVCCGLLKELYIRLKAHDGIDLRAKKQIEIAYRLCFPLESGKVDTKKSEAVFSLEASSVEDIVHAVQCQSINTIYILDSSQRVEMIPKIYESRIETMVLVGVDFDLFRRVFRIFPRACYFRFAHYEKPIIYIIKR